MHLGVHLVRFTSPADPARLGPALARAGRAADDAGITHLSLMDHYFQMDGMAPADEPMLEGYTALGFLAAHTTRLRLGLLVTGVSYRHPGLLAKIVATLDVLSGGRAELGIGAAWYEREHRGLGVPFPPLVERFERLEETLRICQQMWGADNGPFHGKYYQLDETLCVPSPISKPPILIGGTGEKKTLRMVAQYADSCNIFGQSPEFVGQKLDVLRGHCEALGRDYDTITKTVMHTGSVDDDFVAGMRPYADLGVDTMIVIPPPDQDPDVWIERTCAPLVEPLAAL